MSDDELLAALGAALAKSEADATRYRLAIAALGYSNDETAELTPAEPVRSPAADQPPVRKVPAKRGERPIGVGRGTRSDHAEVVRIAATAGTNIVKAQAAAVAKHYGISEGAAKQRIVKARAHGHYVRIPDDPSVVRPAPAPRPLAAVADEARPADSIPDLVRHTISVHERQPSRDERTPKAPGSTSEGAA